MKTITLKAHNIKQTDQTIQIQLKDGQPTIIKAQKQHNYEFIDNQIGYAPNHIITKRKGKDLIVSFEKEGIEPDLIIQDFYNNQEHALIGKAEDGQYYYYIPDTGEIIDYVTQLTPNSIQGQALGGEHLIAPLWIASATPAGIPWWLGLVGVPLLFKNGNDHKTTNDDNTQIKNDSAIGEIGKPITLHVTNNDGNVKADSVRLIDPNTKQPVTSITVPGQGTWTVKPGTDEVTFTPRNRLHRRPHPDRICGQRPKWQSHQSCGDYD